MGVTVARRGCVLAASAIGALERVRTVAATLSEVEESLSFGNPTFRVNRDDCLRLHFGALDRERFLKGPGWFVSPYDRHRTALCCALERFDWCRLRSLLRASYGLAQTSITEDFKIKNAATGLGEPIRAPLPVERGSAR